MRKFIAYRLYRLGRRLTLLGGFFLFTCSEAFASTSGSLPWDGPIKIFTNDLTGPVATGVSVAAFFAAGATLIWGEDLGGVARKALYVVLAVSFMIGGYNFLSALGLTGAVI
jgi:type IV secretory pathway VirB2 component (pilin)